MWIAINALKLIVAHIHTIILDAIYSRLATHSQWNI